MDETLIYCLDHDDFLHMSFEQFSAFADVSADFYAETVDGQFYPIKLRPGAAAFLGG